jgi:alpha-L-fucosidase
VIQSWFQDAKFGIFIHWGIYAVQGVDESWAFFNNKVSYDQYMAQLGSFTARHYDPNAWGRLFGDAGAKYAVLTAKHHDGVALWNTEANDLNVVQKTPAAADLIGPYCEAMREHDLKVGLYFSHLDWSHPDYTAWQNPHPGQAFNRFTFRDGDSDPEAWERFVAFRNQQVQELCTRFGKVDLLWFDGDWDFAAEIWRMKELRAQILRDQPGCVINSRMRGHGDYETPEQGIPILAPEGPWEFCVTMNDNWGYQPQDRNYKSSHELIQMLCECAGMGGNMLLDVGPMENGMIPEPQEQRLREIGTWLRGNGEGIYGTRAGLPFGHFHGPSTRSGDGSVLYLFLFGGIKGSAGVKGIRNGIRSVEILSTGERVEFRKIGGAAWNDIPGILWMSEPKESFDEPVTVIKVTLEGELSLYRGRGEHISVN